MSEIKDDAALFIRQKREKLGFTLGEFSEILNLGESGENRLFEWEQRIRKIPASKLHEIEKLPDEIRFRAKEDKFNFIDLFAGIGGIRLPFQERGGKCVFTSEWDKSARKTYAVNFGEIPAGDITKVNAADVPNHEILLAGFPCQAFSQAGLKKGFHDTRGTMFFEIQKILAQKKPKAFLLENVKQLRGHNKKQTLKTILEVLQGEFDEEVPADVPLSEETRKALSEKLNYEVFTEVLNAAHFGLPQNRERLYIVGFDREFYKTVKPENLFKFPVGSKMQTRVGSILEDSLEVDPKYTISERIWEGHQRRKREHRERGNGFGFSLFNAESKHTNTISARYYKDGSEALIDQSEINKRPRVLTPKECAGLQGFPENFIYNAVSDAQSYRQFGNSVAVPVVRAIAEQMLITLGYLSKETLNYHTQTNAINGKYSFAAERIGI